MKARYADFIENHSPFSGELEKRWQRRSHRRMARLKQLQLNRLDRLAVHNHEVNRCSTLTPARIESLVAMNRSLLELFTEVRFEQQAAFRAALAVAVHTGDFSVGDIVYALGSVH